MDFNEILGFYSLAYWYTWQVTILGLGPIWMGKNEAVKQKTARLLEEGGIFAFGLSEKEHGADLYSSDMALTPMGDGQYRADGGKYYIGNGNEAALVSTFAKNSETDEYVFFAVDSKHENYECVQNVVNSQKYVAEYALHGYPLTDDDILTTGSEAWDSSLNTINVGKYNLGWASIGICTHAFYEAINHAAGRFLFKHYVTDFPHIRQLFVDAYTRLCAMSMFAARAADYMRSASADDRRYLLYNPMVKMKVTTQGEEVINLLWDVIAAKGFEKDTYFEMAARDIRALPKLEGTVHVNMALIIKFMANYFFNPGPVSGDRQNGRRRSTTTSCSTRDPPGAWAKSSSTTTTWPTTAWICPTSGYSRSRSPCWWNCWPLPLRTRSRSRTSIFCSTWGNCSPWWPTASCSSKKPGSTRWKTT